MTDIELQLRCLEFIATQCLFFLTTVIIPTSYRNLSIVELIKKCIISSHDSSKAWDEFKARFDQHIQYCLYNTYSKFYKYTNSDEMNETLKDLKQDVYIKLLDNDFDGLRKFKGKSTTSLKAYLAVVSRNLTLNFVSRNKERFATNENLENKTISQLSANTDNSIFPDLEEKHLQEYVIKILKKHYNSRKFSRDAIIFKLFYFDSFTSKELADKFELSASGIETLVARMKKVVKENYKREEVS